MILDFRCEIVDFWSFVGLFLALSWPLLVMIVQRMSFKCHIVANIGLNMDQNVYVLGRSGVSFSSIYAGLRSGVHVLT